jgi:hypothetical protein
MRSWGDQVVSIVRASNEGRPLSTSLHGSGQGYPRLRASDEHRFIVRVLRARRAPGRSLIILRRARVPGAKDQRGYPATLPPLTPVLPRPYNISSCC